MTTEDRPFAVDECVLLTAHGRQVGARVVVVTAPGSLLLEIPRGLSGATPMPMSMPVMRRPDGVWIEIVNQTAVSIVRREPGDYVPPAHAVQMIAAAVGGRVDSFTPNLGDGSGCATVSYPLPAHHWLYAKLPGDEYEAPPMPFRMGARDPLYRTAHEAARAAAKYAIRSATDCGREPDYDPDALVQNFLVGLFGYHTADGLSADAFANPKHGTPVLRVQLASAPTWSTRLAAWWRR